MVEVNGEVHREIVPKAGPKAGKGWHRGLAAVVAAALVGALSVKAMHDTLDDPVVRSTSVTLPGLSRQTGPLRILLISDTHVSGPDMPPERLTRIVAELNQLHPDMVLLAGDFVSDKLVATRHYSTAEALAPLAGLRARWGTVAVLGNHDYMRGAGPTRAALRKLGIHVLSNSASRVGPLTIGGLGDLTSNDAKVDQTIDAMRHLGGPTIMLAHQPDSFADLPRDIPLMLAGHTHCGQIAPPLIGPIETGSDYGRRYVCGVVREHGATLVVGAGLGTSDLPFRFGAHNDVWLITLTPP